MNYWTVWSAGHAVCSKHKTFAAAYRHARKCEKGGGAFHQIFAVLPVIRPDEEWHKMVDVLRGAPHRHRLGLESRRGSGPAVRVKK